MKVFVDTVAFCALLDRSDPRQQAATGMLATAFSSGLGLVTSNYVCLESNVLIASRLGRPALLAFQRDLLPAVTVEWVTPRDHDASVMTQLAARRCRLGLVDCTSFHLMTRLGIRTVFTFDDGFREQGFEVVP